MLVVGLTKEFSVDSAIRAYQQLAIQLFTYGTLMTVRAVFISRRKMQQWSADRADGEATFNEWSGYSVRTIEFLIHSKTSLGITYVDLVTRMERFFGPVCIQVGDMPRPASSTRSEGSATVSSFEVNWVITARDHGDVVFLP